ARFRTNSKGQCGLPDGLPFRQPFRTSYHAGMDDRTSAAATAQPAPVRDYSDIPSWDVDPATPLYRIRPIALLFSTRVTSNISNHMITVAVVYQVYDLTSSASLLGLIGLAQFMPPLLLMLFAGQVSDRINRRHVLRCCYAVEFCAA